MKRKVAIFAFNGDLTCFAHALLNVLDMHKRGYDAKLVIEGNATRQTGELWERSRPFSNLYGEVKEAQLIDCVCQACSDKTGALESAKEQGLSICGDMAGHPSMARYIEDGYQVIVV
jgi:hypothetical protein